MMESKQALISIITLNWNQTEVTCEFLQSSRKLSYKNYEILVCDMGSDLDPTEIIENLKVPNVKVFRNEENLGFAGGNNWGVKQAKGDFIFFVNNDTELTANLIEDLLNPFSVYERVGVTCPKILFFSNPGIIQYAGFEQMCFLTGRVKAVGSREEDDGRFDNIAETYGAHGCAMMVRRDVIDLVGVFPESFFLYYEEWDLSIRIRKAGFGIFYCGNAKIFHKESVTVGKESNLKVYYQTRNRILFMRRNANFIMLFLFTLFFFVFSVPKSTMAYLIRGKSALLSSFFKGIVSGFSSSTLTEIY